ncbi:MAG: Fe-S protein assembly co-chaperone HscB [Phycisphaerae bacterium]|nr:Fe-S protein assembly co-chaperone HscB [Phycisphaerae bacterium]
MSTSDNAVKPSLPAKCVKCRHDLKNPAICGHCQTVYPVDGVNYFDLLGLETTYDIDPRIVRERYVSLARAVHPDRLRADTPEVEQLSLRTTAQINRARDVLLDPVMRAEYLLGMAGGPSAADEKSVSQDVLMDSLALREEIEEARAANDAGTLASCLETVRGRHADVLARVAELARQLPGDEDLRHELRVRINVISYYRKMLEQDAEHEES